MLVVTWQLISAQQCSQVDDICVKECDCCNSGTPINEPCEISRAQHLDICTGENPWMHDSTSYKLESMSIENEEWKLIQEGELIFSTRTNETEEMECIQIPVSMASFYLEHRVTYPTSRGRHKGYSTEVSGLELHGICGSEVCSCVTFSMCLTNMILKASNTISIK